MSPVEPTGKPTGSRGRPAGKPDRCPGRVSGWRRSDQAALARQRRRPPPGGDPELSQDGGDVPADRPRAEEAGGVDQTVVAVVAGERAVDPPANNLVVARSAGQDVGAVVAGDEVVAGTALDGVLVVPAEEAVVARRRVRPARRRPSGRRRRRARARSRWPPTKPSIWRFWGRRPVGPDPLISHKTQNRCWAKATGRTSPSPTTDPRRDDGPGDRRRGRRRAPARRRGGTRGGSAAVR